MSDSQDAKNEKRARQRAQALLDNATPDQVWSFDQVKQVINAGLELPPGTRITAPTSMADFYAMDLGSGASPIETMGLQDYLNDKGLTLQQYVEQTESQPFRWNNDGSVTYDPAFQKVAYEHTPASYGRNLQIGLGLMAALTGAGLSGVGQAGSLGTNFSSSFAPTITEGTVAGATTGGTFSPLASLETMAGSLGSGGSLATTGVGGALEGALGAGAAAGGAGAGAGALEFLNTTPIDFGSTLTNAGSTLGSGEINFLDTLTNSGGLPTGTVNPVNVDLMNPNWTIDDLITSAASGGETITSGLGPTLEGLGTAAGGASGASIPWIQDLLGSTTGSASGGLSLLDAVKKLFGGNGTGTGSGGTGGTNLTGVGTSALQMLMSKYLADKYDALARDLSDRADPFGSTNVKGLRADAQNEYKTQYSGGPLNWMETTYKPFAEQNMDIALRRLATKVGNPAMNPGALAEAVKYVTNTGYNDYLKGRSQVAGESGASVNPASAASLYGQQSSNAINQLGNMGGALGAGISYATGGTGNQGTDNTVNFIKNLTGALSSIPSLP